MDMWDWIFVGSLAVIALCAIVAGFTDSRNGREEEEWLDEDEAELLEAELSQREGA